MNVFKLLSHRHNAVLRRICLALLVFIVASSIMNISTPAPVKAQTGFVTTQGTRFMLNGRPFYVAGTNNHYLGWGTQFEVDDVLTASRNMGFNVVRTIMHSIRGSLDSTAQGQGTVPLKWNWPSTADSSNMGMKGVYIMYWDTATNTMKWNDSTTTGLGRWDYVIWKAEQLGLKLDIALLDFWQWAGGTQQINANYKGGNYDVFSAPDRYTFFYSNASTRQMYKDWASHVLNRTNTLTGRLYKNEPAIMAWDLMNEPEIANTTLGQAWVSEMAAHIKSIDSNHLLATGSEGFIDGHVGSNPALEMNQPNIDFGTWHTYPSYHGYESNAINGGNSLITQHCATAASGGKPVILQEFAFSKSKPTEQHQANVYDAWLNTIYNNNDCAGWMFWRLEGLQEGGQYPPDNGEGFGVFNDNGPTATVLRNRAAQLLTKNCASCPTNTPLPPTRTNTPAPPTATRTRTPTNTATPVITGNFVKGINFNGNAVTIEGRSWLSYSAALSQGLTVSGGNPDTKTLTPIPAVDADTSHMLNTLLYSATDPGNINLSQTITNGTYQVYVWTMENWQGNSRRWNLRLEGTQVATDLGLMPLNEWRRYGPYNAAVADGVLNVDLIGVQGRSMIMGLAIYTQGTVPTNTPGGATATRTPTRTNTPVLPTNTPTRTGPTATRTNTPVPPTATRTPTRTNTPGATNTPVSSSLKIQSRANEASANPTSIQPFFRIHNTGSASVPMSELKIRYYFTKDNTRPILWNCVWAQPGCGTVSGTVVAMATPKTNADTYLELSFTAAAGSIAAGGNSGEIQNYMKHDDWSAFTQTNDFSFNVSNPYIDWNKVTLYRNGTLVWGTEP